MMMRHALFLKTWNEEGEKGWWYYECPTCGGSVRVASQTILKGKDLEKHAVYEPRKKR